MKLLGVMITELPTAVSASSGGVTSPPQDTAYKPQSPLAGEANAGREGNDRATIPLLAAPESGPPIRLRRAVIPFSFCQLRTAGRHRGRRETSRTLDV